MTRAVLVRALPKPNKGPCIRFCETNPFCFLIFVDGSLLFAETYVVCSGVFKWVRSPKTNPFSEGIWRANHTDNPPFGGCFAYAGAASFFRSAWRYTST